MRDIAAALPFPRLRDLVKGLLRTPHFLDLHSASIFRARICMTGQLGNCLVSLFAFGVYIYLLL